MCKREVWGGGGIFIVVSFVFAGVFYLLWFLRLYRKYFECFYFMNMFVLRWVEMEFFFGVNFFFFVGFLFR